MHYVHNIVLDNPILNSLVPINESVWEHMKMIFFPLLFFFVYNYSEEINNKGLYIFSFIISVTVSILYCILAYYIYTNIFPNISEILNIISYYISMLIGFLIIYKLNTNEKIKNIKLDSFIHIGEITILIYIFIFILFTYFPPNLGLFISP